MKLKNKTYEHIAFRMSQVNLTRFYKLKDDDRATAPYKLVYFCGARGVNYLNASLVSVYKSWATIPEVIVMTDGTPAPVLVAQMIKWPRKIEVISSQRAIDYYQRKGDNELSSYATKSVWGKKLISVLYLAESFDVVYSDSDVLWFSEPPEAKRNELPYIKLGEDVKAYYDDDVINAIGEEYCKDRMPLNSGVIRIQGDFSVYPKWKALCSALNNFYQGGFTEQTSFAILANYFHTKAWNHNEVLIKLGDQYNLKDSRKAFPGIMARHYVSEKTVTFWRDFAFTALKA